MSESNGYMTREKLFGGEPPKRRFKDIVVEGLGKFRIRSLTALEANTIQAKVLAEDDTDQKVKEIVSANVRYIIQSAVDADGLRIFGEKDAAKLLEFDAKYINDFAKQCQEFSTDEEVSREEAEKNSSAIAD